MIEQGVETHEGKHRLCGEQKIDKPANHGDRTEKAIARILNSLVFTKQMAALYNKKAYSRKDIVLGR
jgi:hypothetical protein